MKKLFTNDKFFFGTVLISALGNFTAFLLIAFNYIASWKLGAYYCLAQAVFTLVLYASYKKHNKNVMKGMLGALLATELTYFVDWVESSESTGCPAFIYILLALIAVIFVNHFVINSTHKAKPAHITINKAALFLFASAFIVWTIVDFNIMPGVVYKLISVLTAIAFPCTVCTIVCVEARLDAYRLDRESAGWDEENGYPEGYVHEYQKNK